MLVAAAAGGGEAIGQRLGAAVVHEGRAAAEAQQRRHLERLAGADVDGLVVGEAAAPLWQVAQADLRVV